MFSRMGTSEHQQINLHLDHQTGLKVVVAVYDTKLGPAFGPTRILDYDDDRNSMADAMRLATALSYKAAVANLDCGGGAGIIVGVPPVAMRDAMLAAYGRIVESYKGQFITAGDLGSTHHDITVMRTQSKWVVPGEIEASNPVLAAQGVMAGMKMAASVLQLPADLKGARVAVQGLGKVGYCVAEELAHAGARLFVTALDQSKSVKVARDLGATYVEPDEIYKVDCDIFSPCARGAVLNAQTIPQLKAKIVCGCANGQLKNAEAGEELYSRRILYVPDYAVNSGALINTVASMGGKYESSQVKAQVAKIADVIQEIIADSSTMNIPPDVAAGRIAEERMQSRRNRQN